MSEATRRLSSACKLQPSGKTEGNGSDSGGSFDEKNLEGKGRLLFEQRKKSVGNEMVGVLQVLGKVSYILLHCFFPEILCSIGRGIVCKSFCEKVTRV